MIGVAEIPAAWGPVRVAADEHAVVALEVLSSDEAFAASCFRRIGVWPVPAQEAARSVQRRLDTARVAIDRLLRGEPPDTSDVAIALTGSSAWDRLVLGAVRQLAWGETISYGQLAERIGRRGAARAVGGAVGRNPIGLLVPCHRVIAGDGTLGGYGGGWFGEREMLLEIKTSLLALEGNHPERRRS